MSKQWKKQKIERDRVDSAAIEMKQFQDELSRMDSLPVTYQALIDFFATRELVNPFALRNETFQRIEHITGRPLICYTAKTNHLSPGIPAYIDNGDLTGFGDLIRPIQESSGGVQPEAVDVFIESNGGSPEAAERIVRLLHEHFKIVRFIVPANAYSAATLMCFSGDEIIMDSLATLGPIDPQINGVPARAIQRAFETIEKRLMVEGPRALTAYMPLISKYDLPILEMCKSFQELSEELAKTWLSTYMLKCEKDTPPIPDIVNFFINYDLHKSHGRSIDRGMAESKGLRVKNVEMINGLADLVRSLHNQYEFWFDKTPFYKMFENARGINWRLSV